MRMDRRAGLLYAKSLPTLAELLADLTEVAFDGSGSSSSFYRTFDVSGIDASTPYYLFVSIGLRMKIVKVTGSTITSLNYDTDFALAISDGTITAQYNSYGATFMAARFPHYSDDDVDAVLSALTITRKAYKNSSGLGSIYADYSKFASTAVYMTAFGGGTSGMSFSVGTNTTEPLAAYQASSGTVSSKDYAFIMKKDEYMFVTTTHTDNGTYRNGGIWELVEAA